jgi:hypothetical protein
MANIVLHNIVRDNQYTIVTILITSTHIDNQNEEVQARIENDTGITNLIIQKSSTLISQSYQTVVDTTKSIKHQAIEAILNVADKNSMLFNIATLVYKNTYWTDPQQHIESTIFKPELHVVDNITIHSPTQFKELIIAENKLEEDKIYDISTRAAQDAKKALISLFTKAIKQMDISEEDKLAQIEKLEDFLEDEIDVNIFYGAEELTAYADYAEKRLDINFQLDIFLPIGRGEYSEALKDKKNLYHMIYNLYVHEATHLLGYAFSNSMFPESTTISAQRLLSKDLTPGLVQEISVYDKSSFIDNYEKTMHKLFSKIEVSNDTGNFSSIDDNTIGKFRIILENVIIKLREKEKHNKQTAFGQRMTEPTNGYIDGLIVSKNPLETIVNDINANLNNDFTSIVRPNAYIEELYNYGMLNHEEFSIMMENQMTHSSLNITFLEEIFSIEVLSQEEKEDLIFSYCILIGQKRNYETILANLKNQSNPNTNNKNTDNSNSNSLK